MACIPARSHVVLASAQAGTQRTLRQALLGPGASAGSEVYQLRERNTHGGQPPLPQFALVCVDTVDGLTKKVVEAQEAGTPCSLIFIEFHKREFQILQDLVERVWILDHTVRIVFCLSSHQILRSEAIILSRPDQWAILRIPCHEQEVLQLACCLSSPIVKGSGHPAASGPLPELDLQANDWQEKTEELESARDELAASRYYVDNILRSMADSLLVINADMTIGAVNPSLLRLLGYEEHNLIGKPPGLIFGEELAQGVIMESLLLQGSVSGVESSFLTAEGQKVPISVSGSMMQNQQGQFQGLVCVAQDITERKRMEEEKLQLHEQLVDTSRQLGMAEVATGVLHNVGNVLNSINVSIGVISDLLRNSMVGDVGRISNLLEQHREDLGGYLSQNPKGKQIPGYLNKLSVQLLEERRKALVELNRLQENAGHAQYCVAAQQDFATPKGVTEPVCIGELVDEAVVVNQDGLAGGKIDVIREFQEVPQIIVDKHQVLRILVDLIRNACQAMESALMKQLVVRVKLIAGPPDSICVEVQDSGKGIHPDNLTKIFGQGYSVKSGGRGLSLHHGALAAKNMGGSLRAQSLGEGQGATFSLDLPGHFHFPNV